MTTDQFVYQFDFPGQPIVFIAHSSLVPEGTTVLTNAQSHKCVRGECTGPGRPGG